MGKLAHNRSELLLKAAGWIGSLALAFCAAPQAWLVWQQGHALGMSGFSLFLWVLGEFLLILYVLPQRNWPLLTNYVLNLLLLTIIVYYYIVGG